MLCYIISLLDGLLGLCPLDLILHAVGVDLGCNLLELVVHLEYPLVENGLIYLIQQGPRLDNPLCELEE
jgi:hypothetical protein